MKEPNERDREEISDDLETSSFQIPPPQVYQSERPF
jgi:hypothetical protein